jgi:hypothetical protein
VGVGASEWNVHYRMTINLFPVWIHSDAFYLYRLARASDIASVLSRRNWVVNLTASADTLGTLKFQARFETCLFRRFFSPNGAGDLIYCLQLKVYWDICKGSQYLIFYTIYRIYLTTHTKDYIWLAIHSMCPFTDPL